MSVCCEMIYRHTQGFQFGYVVVIAIVRIISVIQAEGLQLGICHDVDKELL